ncbi:MAG: DUF1684 domain-containing protein [Acidobacteriaceae bacterium]|nr:DUF1684 domain-containing protein [Acidobacteriaceae bacterium]
MFRFLIGMTVFVGLMFAGLAMAKTDTGSNYPESLRAWQQKRDAGLRSPNGWLTLVGLFWLKPGDNSIGSADSNDFVLPKGSAPAQVGRLHLEGSKITFTAADGSSRSLSYDEDKPDVVHAGTVSFYIIKRGDRFAVRAKDSASPVLKDFQGMKYFPANPELHFTAKFIPDPQIIPILNILGETEMQESPGVVEFLYKGQVYRLRPVYEGKTLFFLFKDPTNKTGTYQAGRMLNTPLPADGKVDLDFNHSYNPPCTFTPYATCPLPPKENTLPFPVEAGELRYGKGHAEYAEAR